MHTSLAQLPATIGHIMLFTAPEICTVTMMAMFMCGKTISFKPVMKCAATLSTVVTFVIVGWLYQYERRNVQTEEFSQQESVQTVAYR